MESWFEPGVVCPDGTVMWSWEGDDASSHWAGGSDQRSQSSTPALASAVEHSDHVHYHYYRFGMGPWLFLGLQVSLAIALLLILSPDSKPPAPEASWDSLSVPTPDYLIGFLY